MPDTTRSTTPENGSNEPFGPQAVLGAVAKGLARYRYVLTVVSAVLLLLALLPEGGSPAKQAAGQGAGGGSGGSFTTIDPTPGRGSNGGGAGTQAAGGSGAGGGTAGTTATTGGAGGATSGTSTTSTTTGAAAGGVAVEVGLLPDLPARLPVEQGEAYRVHVWHHGSPPPAKAAHGLIYTVPWIFYTGMHLGGPVVTPETIRDGLFRFPPTGRGSLTNVHISFGRHGVWSFDDYLANDDATEVWWDGTASGEDEVGNSGLGLYRYVDGGRRYLPGQHPTTDPFVFARERTVTIYDEPPPSDRPPSYEHKD